MDDDSDAYRKIMIPMIRRVMPNMMATDIMGIQPMTGIQVKWDREFALFMVLDSGEIIYNSYVYKLNEYVMDEYQGFMGKCVSEEEYFAMSLLGTEKEDEYNTSQTGKVFSLGTSNRGIGKV